MQDFVVRIEGPSQLWLAWQRPGAVGSRELRSLTPRTGAEFVNVVFIWFFDL